MERGIAPPSDHHVASARFPSNGKPRGESKDDMRGRHRLGWTLMLFGMLVVGGGCGGSGGGGGEDAAAGAGGGGGIGGGAGGGGGGVDGAANDATVGGAPMGGIGGASGGNGGGGGDVGGSGGGGEDRLCPPDPPCPGNQSCNPETGECVPPDVCEGHDDCAPDVCIDGECVEGCLDDANCADRRQTPYCDADTGLCVPCTRNTHCYGGSSCDPEAHRCMDASPCVENLECYEGRVCIAEVCTSLPDCNVDGCADNEICLADGTCLIDAGVCVGEGHCPYGSVCRNDRPPFDCGPCEIDAHCSGEQACVNGPDGPVCVEPGVCEVDDDCMGTRVCIDGGCGAPACEDDGFEDNDVAAGATVLQAFATFDGLASCDDDWFAIDIDSGVVLSVTVRFDDASSANIDLALYDEADNAIAVSDGVQRVESAAAGPFDVPTRVLIRVYQPGLSTAQSYMLSLDVELEPTCVDDEHEGGLGDDSLETATVIREPGEIAIVPVYRGVACGGDDDWLIVHLGGRERIQLDVDLDFDALAVRAELYSPNPANLEPVATGTWGRAQQNERLDYLTIGAGPYALRLTAQGETAGPYTLNLGVVPAGLDGICRDAEAIDLDEGGEATVQSTLVGLDNSVQASCEPAAEMAGDKFYTVALDEPRLLIVSARGLEDGTLGDPVISVRTSCLDAASEIACSRLRRDIDDPVMYRANPAEVRIPVPAPGEYTIVVDGVRAGLDPGFEVGITTRRLSVAPRHESCDSALALPLQNGIAEVTVALDRARDDHAAPCLDPGGPDAVYRLNLERDAEVMVQLDADYPIGAWLTRDCDAPEAAVACGFGLQPRRLAAGDYFLVVDGADGNARGLATLRVTVLDGVAPPAHDSCATPLELASVGGLLQGSTRGVSDDHVMLRGNPCTRSDTVGGDLVYELNFEAGDRVWVKATPIGGWDLSLYAIENCQNPSGSCQAASDGALTERFVYTANGDDRLLVVVDGAGGESGPFTLAWGPVECALDGECGDGARCANNGCYATCDSDDGCGDGARCVRALCLATCRDQDDCRVGNVCRQGICELD